MASPKFDRGFTEKRFAASNVSIHYAEGPPSGPPLLLLHGLTRDWRSFFPLLPELSCRFHAFSVDLRGHGGSGRVAGGYRISQFALDISEFVRTLLPEGAAIFGHSLGAMVAMEVAAQPDCPVRALIVGDTMITSQNFFHSLYTPLFRQLHQLILACNSQTELAAGIGKISIHIPELDEFVRIEELPGNTPGVLEEWARCALQTDPDVMSMMLDGRLFEGWCPDVTLPQISCPTLLLQGNPELDGLLSDEDVKLALQLLPNAQHVKFPLLGHGLFMQNPKPVLNEVYSFLSTIQF